MPRPPKPARLKLVEGRSPAAIPAAGKSPSRRSLSVRHRMPRTGSTPRRWPNGGASHRLWSGLTCSNLRIGRSCPRTARPGPSTSRRFSGSAPKASQLPHRNPVSCTGTRR